MCTGNGVWILVENISFMDPEIFRGKREGGGEVDPSDKIDQQKYNKNKQAKQNDTNAGRLKYYDML